MIEPRQHLSDARQLYSGLIRLHILHHSAEQGIFGLGMIEELARHGYKLSPGTLYPILHGLQEGGLLRSYEVCVKGKIRRIYRITAEGQRALTAAKEKVRELFGELFEHGAEYKQRRALAQVVSVPAALYRRRRASHTTA